MSKIKFLLVILIASQFLAAQTQKKKSKEAVVFIQDIYEGQGLKGVPRGTVKAIRVLAYDFAYINSPSNHMAQGIQSGWDIKRLIGVVPVEADGSVMFKVPSNTPIAFQPLDADGCAVQLMRSWTTGMPGEVISCTGCHEDQNQIPQPKRTLASMRAPQEMTKPEGGIRPFTFKMEVQPVLDRACVACHSGKNDLLDFTGEKIDEVSKFGKSYLKLHPYVYRQGPEAEMQTLNPYEYHASVSPLVQMLRKGHHGVKLQDKEWRTLYTWIDFNAPYNSTFKANPYNGVNQIKRRMELTDKYGGNSSIDWEKEIEMFAEYRKKLPPIVPVKPEQQAIKSVKQIKLKGWPFSAEQAKALLAKEKKDKKVIDLGAGIKMNFVRIPAGSYVMGKNGSSDFSPAHIVKITKAFWMGEIEVSNEQMRALIASHNSRFIGQQWKDHVNPGYEANNPKQPAIRMSWNEAMDFCRLLSQRTGLKCSLPTEEQWEWACRAGSDTDFWYGNLNTNFAAYENLADKQLNKMAVSGVNPQPMPESWYWFKYYTYHPKDASVDDGSFLTVPGAKYAANPFGLFDMQGNVSEWTRSDYLPYGLKEKNKPSAEQKVVRGGSWIDPPKSSTSYFRKAFLPWQRVYNVGFRIIIEE